MYSYIAKKLSRYPLDLQFFAEDPNPNPDPDPNPNPDPNDPNKGKVFTQAELDQQIQSRLSRAEKAAQKTLAVSLGFESVEAMQAALKKPDPKKDEPVDVDKLVEDKLKEQSAKTFKRLLSSEVKVLANELGFADWEDALALADLTTAAEDDKGNLTGVKEALEELAKKKPHLLKAKQGGGKFGADISNSTADDKKKRREDIVKLAQSRGAVGGTTAHDPWAKK